jgi:hypothetical protein
MVLDGSPAPAGTARRSGWGGAGGHRAVVSFYAQEVVAHSAERFMWVCHSSGHLQQPMKQGLLWSARCGRAVSWVAACETTGPQLKYRVTGVSNSSGVQLCQVVWLARGRPCCASRRGTRGQSTCTCPSFAAVQPAFHLGYGCVRATEHERSLLDAEIGAGDYFQFGGFPGFPAMTRFFPGLRLGCLIGANRQFPLNSTSVSPGIGALRVAAFLCRGTSGACACTWSARPPGCRSCRRWRIRRPANARSPAAMLDREPAWSQHGPARRSVAVAASSALSSLLSVILPVR